MFDPYYIDRDSRPKTKPCQFCARNVELVGRGCTCVPSQPRHVPVTSTIFFSGDREAVALQPDDRRVLRFLNEEPDL